MGDWSTEITDSARKKKFIRFRDLILLETEDVILVNKPRGFVSIPDRWDKEGTSLFGMGQKYFPDLMVCHRLDKMTTGLMVFAKNPDAHRDISIQFQDREIVKHYSALAMGVKDIKDYVVDAPINVVQGGKVKIDNLNGKPATTVFDTAELFEEHTLFDCQPLTGRTHQVRIHLSVLGSPIVGDTEYGGKDVYLSHLKYNYKPNRRGEERPLNDGYLLHAAGLYLRLPGEEESRNFIAPLPEHFEVVLRMLRKFAS